MLVYLSRPSVLVMLLLPASWAELGCAGMPDRLERWVTVIGQLFGEQLTARRVLGGVHGPYTQLSACLLQYLSVGLSLVTFNSLLLSQHRSQSHCLLYEILEAIHSFHQACWVRVFGYFQSE